MFDVIVAGLGPAGSSAAYDLARRGFKVLGLDKETFPRYKSCGGCISTKIERILDFPIDEAIDDTVYGATFTYKSDRKIDIISDRPVGHNVMRDKFDYFLVKKAIEAGAQVLEGRRVTNVTDSGERVTVKCANGESFSAKFLIGADGAAGFVGRSHFGLDPKQVAVSVTAEVPYNRDSAGCKGRLFIDFGSVPYGYAWVFPKEKFLSAGIAGDVAKVGGRIKGYFDEFLRTHHSVKGLCTDDRIGWTVPIYYTGAPSSVKGRVALAGDTGHLVDPFLGEGIYFAIRTAKGAAGVIAGCLQDGTSDLTPYQSWLEKEIIPEFRSAEKLSDLVYTHPRLWYSIVERDPELMLRYYDVIRGIESCDSFYSWVYGKVRSKPWKMLRRWVESRFLPS